VILNDNGRFFHQVVDKAYVADLVRRAKAEVEHERKMQVDL
jgi:hypothetical protein